MSVALLAATALPAPELAGQLAGYAGEIGLVALIVAVNAFFVAAEFALVRVRPAQLEERVKRGETGSRHALYLVSRLDETLSICQVGITLTSLGLGWVGEEAFAGLLAQVFSPTTPWLGAASLTLSLISAFMLLTFLHVVLGELVPKSVALSMSERVSLVLAPPLRLFGTLAWPLVWILNGAAWWILRPLGLASGSEGQEPSLDEIRTILARTTAHGHLVPMNIALLDNLFRFARRRARDVMVPSSRIVAIDVRLPLEEQMVKVRAEGYSRYPLIYEDLDQVVGIVHIKDVLGALAEQGTMRNLRSVARPPMIVPETMPLEQLLLRFQHQHAHLAVVADEYGSTTGIVTLEDVLEELVGELRDEFDAGEQDPIRALPGGGFLLDPMVPLDRAADLIGAPHQFPEEVHSVGGLLQFTLGRVPTRGDRVPFGEGFELIAKEVQGTRVTEVELIPRGT